MVIIRGILFKKKFLMEADPNVAADALLSAYVTFLRRSGVVSLDVLKEYINNVLDGLESIWK